MTSMYAQILSVFSFIWVVSSVNAAGPQTSSSKPAPPVKLASGWSSEDKQFCDLSKQLVLFMRAVEKFGWEEMTSPDEEGDSKDLKEARKFSKCSWMKDKQIASSVLLEAILKLPKDNKVKIECCSLFKNSDVRNFFTEDQQFLLGLSCGDLSFMSDS